MSASLSAPAVLVHACEAAQNGKGLGEWVVEFR